MSLNPGLEGGNRSFLKWCVLASAAALVLELWLFRPIIHDYFPSADELALEVASTSIAGHLDPSSWFTHGFHGYFDSFSEWQGSYTDFWRPLANSLFWVFYQLFGSHWAAQLVFGYLTHALMVGLSGYVAWRIFNLNRWLCAAAMAITAFSPAFWSSNDSVNSFAYNSVPELIQYPIFQTEILCALLMMCAFIAFMARRYLLFCLVTTVALLLKETALTVPVAALLIAAVWWRAEAGRAPAKFTWLALPLVIWCLAKAVLFDYGKSIYVLTSASAWGWLLKPVRHLLLLPTLLYRGPLRDTEHAVLSRDAAVVALHGFELAVNAIWWLVLLYAVRCAWLAASKDRFARVPPAWVCGLIFALGNLCLVLILQAPDPRFAYFWFALGPAALFAALSQRRHALAIAIAMAACLLVPQFWAVHRALGANSLRNYHLGKNSARELTALLGHLPATVGTVFLIDDVILQGTGPEYLATFAGYHGRLVVINSIEPMLACDAAPLASPRYRLTRDSIGTQLDYSAPACFYQMNEAPLSQFQANKVPRGKWMTYEFPDLKRPAATPAVDDFDYEPGTHWNVAVNDPSCAGRDACIWLGLDPATQAYTVVNGSQ